VLKIVRSLRGGAFRQARYDRIPKIDRPHRVIDVARQTAAAVQRYFELGFPATRFSFVGVCICVDPRIREENSVNWIFVIPKVTGRSHPNAVRQWLVCPKLKLIFSYGQALEISTFSTAGGTNKRISDLLSVFSFYALAIRLRALDLLQKLPFIDD
jgi:hypothetical protein